MFDNQSTLGQSLYESTAEGLGVSSSELNTCMEREDIQQIVSDHFAEVRGTGATGTPHTLVVVNGEVKGALPGALPYESVVSFLDQVRSEI
jgi:predicted DsbA family dithiol-disulfide isomerase